MRKLAYFQIFIMVLSVFSQTFYFPAALAQEGTSQTTQTTTTTTTEPAATTATTQTTTEPVSTTTPTETSTPTEAPQSTTQSTETSDVTPTQEQTVTGQPVEQLTPPPESPVVEPQPGEEAPQPQPPPPQQPQPPPPPPPPPVQNLPPGCRMTHDTAIGQANVVCEEVACPAREEANRVRDACSSQGGNPISFNDPNGCTFYDCRFDKREFRADPISGYQSCPRPEEVDSQVRSCRDTGLFPAINFEGGCKIVKCIQKEERKECSLVSAPVRMDIEKKCAAQNERAIPDFDANGCQFFRCAPANFCEKQASSQAIDKCSERGGELIVKRDDSGCITFSTCVERSNDRDAYVEPVEKSIDPLQLLDVALKLEEVKVEMQKLAKRSDALADYYRSSGSVDEERFDRVSSMFQSAQDKIDEMREKILSFARDEEVSPEAATELKHDIKYLKDVIMKDVLYLMLSKSDDVKETLTASKKISLSTKLEEFETSEGVKNCGTDGSCFDRALRTCKLATFRPEGSQGPIITITGLDNRVCVVKAQLPEGQGPPPGSVPGIKPPYVMNCRFENYALGVRGPEDFISKCEGTLVELMKRFGGPASGGEADFPPPEGGPGGCTELKQCAQYCLDSYDDCLGWVKDHPAYGPAPSREELQKIASGELPEKVERTGPQFGGPGGCRNDQECSDYCSKNPRECLDWCGNNPGMCPPGSEENLKTLLEGGKRFAPQPRPVQEIRPAGNCECTWPAGTLEHPEGCTVLCDDYSDSQKSCEAQAVNGCEWTSGPGPTPIKEFEMVKRPQPVVAQPVTSQQAVSRPGLQACVGCLNNGVCDVGECSECADCLNVRR